MTIYHPCHLQGVNMMKIKLLLTILVTSLTLQPHATLSKSDFEWTFDIGNYEYEETVGGNFFMSDEADPTFFSLGIRKWGNFKPADLNVMFTTEVTYGQTEYNGSGTLTKDYYKFRYEGYIPFFETGRSRPFIGLGYRWLYDDSGGLISSTGKYGYDRRSQYFYIPIGFFFDFNEKLSFKSQYNLFLHGIQTSYLSDVTSCGDLENDQTNGFGLDFIGDFKLAENSSLFSYYRSWAVDKSNISTSTCGTSLTLYGYEPKNETTEFGIGFSIKF